MEEELITNKQLWFIKKKLYEKGERYDYEDLKKITRYEASGIIKRNIIGGSPLYQWFVWKDLENGELYCNTCRTIQNATDERYLGKIILEPKVFLTKRLAEKYYGRKLERKSPKDYLW